MADKLIVVDVQPDFEPYITFDIKDFVDYLLEFDGEILYIYDSVNGTTENDVINWLYEHTDYYDNEDFEELIYNIEFLDKEYGFFRGAMEKLDESDIIEIVNYMMDNKISDYRDIDISNMPFNNNIKNKFENEEIEIFLPSFDYTILKQYNNSTIIGGGKDKCLAEIIILLNALGLKYTIDWDYVYEHTQHIKFLKILNEIQN